MWTTFAYDAVAGAPSYNAGNETDWMNQVMRRPYGVIPGLDLALVVTSDGAGGVNVQNGACILAGRTALLSAGPQNVSLGTLPSNGFRTSYAVVVRFSSTTQSTDIAIIAGNTIANPGPAVNPSILATDVLLTYVLDVNTAGTHVFTVTDGRSYTDAQLLLPTGNTTYPIGAIGPDSRMLVALTAPSTIDITAGAIMAGTKLFIKNTSLTPQALTLTYVAATSYTINQNQWVLLTWDGSQWNWVMGNATITVDSSSRATFPNDTIFLGVINGKTLSTTPYTLTTADGMLNVTTGGGNIVVNLPAATQIGKQFTIVKSDSGVGSVNITPNGTDKIGQSGNNIYPLSLQYQSIVLECSSSGNWAILSASSGSSGRGRLELMASGSWVCPAGVSSVILTGVAKGGNGANGGGAGSIYTSGGGGGSGAWCRDLSVQVTPGVTYTITISSTVTSFVGGSTSVVMSAGANGSGIAPGAGGSATGGATAGKNGGNGATNNAGGGCGGGGAGLDTAGSAAAFNSTGVSGGVNQMLLGFLASPFGNGGASGQGLNSFSVGNGVAGQFGGGGGGGGGGATNGSTVITGTGGTGGAGFLIVEW